MDILDILIDLIDTLIGIVYSNIFFLKAPYLLAEVTINPMTIIPAGYGTIDQNKKIQFRKKTAVFG
ncbi:MAG: hypothetical protein LBP87_06490 [Planctomycetaceae bacterium]|nr:hypothetical protein [Planctomycetaceae bacterium]